MNASEVAAQRVTRWLRRLRRVVYLAVVAGIAFFFLRYDVYTIPEDYGLLLPQRLPPGTRVILQDVDEDTAIGVGTILSYAPPGYDGLCFGVVVALPGEVVSIEDGPPGRRRVRFGERAESINLPADDALPRGTVPDDAFVLLNGDRAIVARQDLQYPDSRVFGPMPRAALRQKVVTGLWFF